MNTIPREYADWTDLGFSDDERERWIRAGVPVARPEWALMCKASRAFEPEGLWLSPERIRHDRDLREWVFQSFQNGWSLIDVVLDLIEQPEFDKVPVGGVLLLLRDAMTSVSGVISDLDLAFCRVSMDPVARSVPDIASGVTRAAEVLLAHDRAVAVLNAEYEQWRGSRVLGENLRVLANSHGVPSSKVRSSDIGHWVPIGYTLTPVHREVLELIRGCGRSGSLAFISPRTVVAADGGLYLRRRELDESLIERLPIPRGIALVMLPSAGRKRFAYPHLLAWSASPDSVQAVLLPVEDGAEHLRLGRSLEYQHWTRADGDDHVEYPVRLVRLINLVVSVTRSGNRSEGRGVSAGPSFVRTQGRGPQQRDSTVVEYHSEPRGSSGARRRSSRSSSDHRWRVRGHWRRLPPVPGESMRVTWVQEHTSGPAGRPLFEVKRVHVVASVFGVRARDVITINSNWDD